MVLRHRNYPSLRGAVSLGTGLTALFLLVRCSVPARDYSQLGIGENAGSGGQSGVGGSGAGGSDAGGTAGQVGLGGQVGETPIAPVPCDPVDTDAGGTTAAITDAGTDSGTVDAGVIDAGPTDTACECADGFIRAVDADGDGERSRACTLAPGLDCDDADAAVTHNSCGGCTTLPNAVGEACLECGAYTCDGPDAIACGSLPGPVDDPDCRCVDASIAPRDTDGDGQGTRLCEANPGTDCDDGNATFVTNACGGCADLPGAVGAACNQCGVYACVGTALACVPSVGTAGQRCLDIDTRQTCVGTGFWGNDSLCANVCYQGRCEACTPGTFRCVPYGGGSTQVERCNASTSSLGIGYSSYESCSPSETCNANTGTCTGQLLLPRDQAFDVGPLQRGGLPWHDVLNTALDADYG